MFGKKNLYLAGLIIFTIGSVLCGLSSSIYWLIAFRVLQAVGASVIMALGMAMVTETFPAQERGKALGILGTLVSIGIIAGPTIGGIILESLSWHWLFFVNLPVGIIGVFMVLRYVPQSRPGGKQRFDFLGAVLLFISLCALLFALSTIQSGSTSLLITLTLLGIFLVGLVAFIMVEKRIDDPMIDTTKQTPVYVHSVPDEYLFVPVCPTAGMAYKWFKDNFGIEATGQAEIEQSNSYEVLNRLAESVPPGSDGLVMLPHLMGAFSPESNPSARGVFSGFTLHHGRGHFVRAIQEGVAFMLRLNLELIESSGVVINEVRTTGGGSRGTLWNQIKADVCDLPLVTLENEDTALVGDAILAGVACGLFSSIAEGVQRMVRLKDKILPGENVEPYKVAYQRYFKLDKSLAEYFRKNY